MRSVDRTVLKEFINMELIREENGSLICQKQSETLVIKPWGKDGIRVQSTVNNCIQSTDYALSQENNAKGQIQIEDSSAHLINGNIKAELVFNQTHKNLFDKGSSDVRLRFINTSTNEVVLEETYIKRRVTDHYLKPRQYKCVSNENYKTTLQFISEKSEKIFGLGQQQDEILDHKGNAYDLIHHNSIYYIPFIVSDKNYGFLWNNPGTGRVEFSEKKTRWVADSAKQIDYWVTTGQSYSDILENYTEVTGRAPMMPDWGAGYWQCKLRYKTQQELLEAAREYKKRKLPLDVIIIDFFSWTHMGQWALDEKYWPDIEGMVKELEEMGVKPMVSIFPMVSQWSDNYQQMHENGYLVRTNKGHNILRSLADNMHQKYPGGVAMYYYDATNPEAREFLWSRIKENFFDKGIKLFWLDTNEPTLLHNDFDNIRYHIGSGEEVTSIYPNMHVKCFYDGLRSQGHEEIMILCRAGWAGIQKYGALIWSGDVESTFEALKAQVVAGLNVAMSGVPWWTTDAGGHLMEYDDEEYFLEVLVRWFQFAAFCPVMRNHGKRDPNEIWSFGAENYTILKKYLHLRKHLKPYILHHMKIASETGKPMYRPLFFDFSHDAETYEIKDQFMFGDDILVAPVVEYKARSRKVYLPNGSNWQCGVTGKLHEGGSFVEADASLDHIPVFVKDKADIFKVINAGLNAVYSDDDSTAKVEFISDKHKTEDI